VVGSLGKNVQCQSLSCAVLTLNDLDLLFYNCLAVVW
jgi:hypothetical protein